MEIIKNVMRYKFVLLLLLGLNTSCFSQTGIDYFLTDDLSDSLELNLQLNNVNYGCLWNEDTEEGTFILVFFEVPDDTLSPLYELVKSTNRFLNIKHANKIPIVYKSDFKFCSLFNNINEDIVTSSDNLIIGGYVCVINGRFRSGKVTKAFFDR
jgi:hypothetical protein